MSSSASSTSSTGRWRRADLHLHSWHSGRAGHLRFLAARDCYSEPEAIYRTARSRGMDLVTITDHDSIDGCLEFLSRHPGADDFFISEEIECRVPGVDLKIHIGAYGIDERIHREIQPLRRNVVEAAAYLRSQAIFFTLNHPFFFYDGQLPIDAYLAMACEQFPGIEVRNGTMLRAHNELVEALVRRAESVTSIGGSDSHTLAGIGSTYTEAPGATVAEFLASLRAGRTQVGGVHGSIAREAREIYGVVWNYWQALAGAGRPDLSPARRALGIVFSLATLPLEFSPLVIALRHKRAEARRVDRFARLLEDGRRGDSARGVRLQADLRVTAVDLETRS
jgi:predicted metal-dependent phosphoesterase TrpH